MVKKVRKLYVTTARTPSLAAFRPRANGRCPLRCPRQQDGTVRLRQSGKESSQSLQMMERALMTPDELKSIPKGEFVVMKTGTQPMRTKLRLFLDWGITFDGRLSDAGAGSPKDCLC